MRIKIRLGNYFVAALLVACGQTTKIEKVRSEAKGREPLKSSKYAGSSDSLMEKPINKGVTFSLNELTMHQGASKEVEVNLKSELPNGQFTITTPSLPGVKIEILDATGAPLTGAVKLDGQSSGKISLRVTSIIERTAEKVIAPGPLNANLVLNATNGTTQFSGSLPLKVSNVAFVTMSGVSNVRDLPLTFEFPAGTIPIIANPEAKIAKVLHFSGGGTGDFAFKHQSNTGDMPQNTGYCPLNKDAKTLVALDGVVSPNCLPCPSDGMNDLQGNFYNHETEVNSQSRKIVCKKKL